MKRPLIAALFLAGVLTLWATIAGFGQSIQDPATTEALAKVEKCQADAIAKVSGTEAREEIAEIASDARAEISEADKEFAEETKEATAENEPGPNHDAFAKSVDGIATEACEEINAVVDETTGEAEDAQDNDNHLNNDQANVRKSVNQPNNSANGKHEDNDAASSNHEGNHGGNGHQDGDQHNGNDKHKAGVAKATESDDD